MLDASDVDHAHEVLQGSTRLQGKSIRRTELAAEYSAQWCRAVAELIDTQARLQGFDWQCVAPAGSGAAEC